MKILSMIQGSEEWLAARAKHNTASEASVMMGASPRVSRADLVRMKATGDEQEFSRWTEEVLFERGHQVEAAARPLAEEIVGDDLFPVTALDDDGVLLASFDGITLDESVCWECKQWSEAKAEHVRTYGVPEVDYWQVVQQLVVSRAERCLYMVTDGTRDNLVYCWVTLDGDDEALLRSHWAQFDRDVAAYVPAPAEAPAPAGRAPEDLPALRLEVTGAVRASNLEEFREHALAVFAGINTELSTDDDFADAEKTSKWCKKVEDRLEAAKAQALEQTASLDELFGAIDAIREEARSTRLNLDKQVKARKQEIRGEILAAGKAALADHIDDLNKSLDPDRVELPAIDADFAGAMKGKRTVASLRDAVDAELASAKVEADRIAAALHSNAALLDELSEGFESLFADRQALVLKAPDDLAAAVKARIADFNEAQERRRAEEERRAREAREAEQAPPPPPPAAVEKPAPAEDPQPSPAAAQEGAVDPSLDELVAVVAAHYRVTRSAALAWMMRAVSVRRAA